MCYTHHLHIIKLPNLHELTSYSDNLVRLLLVTSCCQEKLTIATHVKIPHLETQMDVKMCHSSDHICYLFRFNDHFSRSYTDIFIRYLQHLFCSCQVCTSPVVAMVTCRNTTYEVTTLSVQSVCYF